MASRDFTEGQAKNFTILLPFAVQRVDVFHWSCAIRHCHLAAFPLTLFLTSEVLVTSFSNVSGQVLVAKFKTKFGSNINLQQSSIQRSLYIGYTYIYIHVHTQNIHVLTHINICILWCTMWVTYISSTKKSWAPFWKEILHFLTTKVTLF